MTTTDTNFQIILASVCRFYRVTVEDMRDKTRKKRLSNARQVVMYLAHKRGFSLQRIGEELGWRDHSTIHHGVEKITNELTRDDELRQQVELLDREIGSVT